MSIQLKAGSVDLLGGRLSIPRTLLDRCCLIESGRAVFLAGSLVEGLGNLYSDLDVYSIGNELPPLSAFKGNRTHRLLSPDRHILRPQDPADSTVFLAHVVVEDTPLKIDVEFQTFDGVQALASRFDELHAYAAANLVLLTRRLPPREIDFIVRLLTGFDYAGDVRGLKSAFDRNRFLYLAYRWLASDFSIVLDLIGVWMEGDLQLAVDTARENVVNQMLAYLHLRGMANLRRKWLLKFVDRILIDEPDIAGRFKSLFFFDGMHADSNTRSAYVLETLDFVEDLFGRSTALLAANGTAPAGDAALEMLAGDRDLSASKYADLEFDYRAKVYGRRGRPLRSYLQERL